MAKELREDGSILYTGEGTITTIERKTKLAKVSIAVEGLQYPESGWWEIAKVGLFSTGDRVAYEILKAPGRDYRDIQKLAPLLGKEGDQALATPRLSTSQGDDVQGGDSEPKSGQPESPAERVTGNNTVPWVTSPDEVPNRDTQRFEGWGFAGQCGIVALAYGELSDAVEGGQLDKLTPALIQAATTAMLNAADQAQRSLVGRTDRSALSHRAAREMVRMAVDKRPLRAQVNDLDAWAESIQKTATRLLLLAASL